MSDLYCSIHGLKLQPGQIECWRCITRNISELNKSIPDVQPRKKLAQTYAHFISMDEYPKYWICMN